MYYIFFNAKIKKEGNSKKLSNVWKYLFSSNKFLFLSSPIFFFCVCELNYICYFFISSFSLSQLHINPSFFSDCLFPFLSRISLDYCYLLPTLISSFQFSHCLFFIFSFFLLVYSVFCFLLSSTYFCNWWRETKFYCKTPFFRNV